MGIKFWNIDISKIKIASGLTPRLPSAYQEVEYLENNWTCYINTWLQIKDGYRSVQKLRFLAYQTSSWGYVTWGYIWPDWWLPWGHARLYVWNWRSWNTWWSYGYLNSYSNWTTATATIGADYEMDFSRVSGDAFLKIDWTSYFTSSTTYSTSLSWPVSVFAGYEPNSPKVHPWLRVYYAKYYDSTGTLVRELIPCYRIADWVIWMYDLVNDTFYTNAGSWVFTKWNDVYPEPYKDIKKVYKWSTQVRPTLWPREPWANTVAYYPLTSATTVNNQVSWGTNLTSSNIVFGIANWVNCATISWNTDDYHNADKLLYWNITWLPTWASPRTFSRWVYQSNAAASLDACYLWQWQTSNNKGILLAQWIDANGDIFISQYWSSSSSASPIIWQRHHNVLVYDGSKFVYYVNTVATITWTYTINTWSNKFSIWWATENGAWSSFNGSFSDLIIENKAWTSQDVADYYNLTKWNYWL